MAPAFLGLGLPRAGAVAAVLCASRVRSWGYSSRARLGMRFLASVLQAASSLLASCHTTSERTVTRHHRCLRALKCHAALDKKRPFVQQHHHTTSLHLNRDVPTTRTKQRHRRDKEGTTAVAAPQGRPHPLRER